MKTFRTIDMVLCAMFAALSAGLSQISIPIGPVPINMTHVSIFIAAGLLGAKYGTVSQIVFVLTGAVGVPVFSSFRGGIDVLVGPTGGFIIGYIGCVFVTGFIIDRLGSSMKVLIPAMYAGWVVTYVCGLIWFMYITGTGLAESMTLCVLPFLPGDIAKTVLSAVLVNRLRPVLRSKLDKPVKESA